MADLTAQRTLVKSPPELWSELSEVESLARHLGELGEIKITKVEPETTVAWEGEQISGTVQLEQSGWGTKVTFHATVPEPDFAEPAPPEPVAETAPVEVEVEVQLQDEVGTGPPPEPRRESWLRAWLFRRRTPVTAPVEPEPVTVEPEPVEPEPVTIEPEPVVTAVGAERVKQVLDQTLDALGQAHHRPFSRG